MPLPPPPPLPLLALAVVVVVAIVGTADGDRVYAHTGDPLTLCVDYNEAPFIICSGCDGTNVRMRFSLVTVLGFLTFNVSSPCALYSCAVIMSPPSNYILYPVKAESAIQTWSAARTYVYDNPNSKGNSSGPPPDNNSTNNNGTQPKPPQATFTVPAQRLNQWQMYDLFVRDILFSDRLIVLATQFQSTECAPPMIVEVIKRSLVLPDCCVGDEKQAYGTGSDDCSIDDMLRPDHAIGAQYYPRVYFVSGPPPLSFTATASTIIFPLTVPVADPTGFNGVIAAMAIRSYANFYTAIGVFNIAAIDRLTLIVALGEYNPTRLKEGLDCLNFIRRGSTLATTVVADFDPVSSVIFLQNVNATANFVSTFAATAAATDARLDATNRTIQNITVSIPSFNLTNLADIEAQLTSTMDVLQAQVDANTVSLGQYQASLAVLFSFSPDLYNACVYAEFDKLLVYVKMVSVSGTIAATMAIAAVLKVVHFWRRFRPVGRGVCYIVGRAFVSFFECHTLFIVLIGLVSGYVAYSLCLVSGWVPFRYLSVAFYGVCASSIFGYSS